MSFHVEKYETRKTLAMVSISTMLLLLLLFCKFNDGGKYIFGGYLVYGVHDLRHGR